jgi:ATP-dependent Clp protease ATP-binding subunit ClpX
MEEVLLPVMFDVPSEDDIARVVVTREVVLDNVLPTIVRRDVPVRAKRQQRKESA